MIGMAFDETVGLGIEVRDPGGILNSMLSVAISRYSIVVFLRGFECGSPHEAVIGDHTKFMTPSPPRADQGLLLVYGLAPLHQDRRRL